MLVTFILGESFIFYNFYKDAKNNIETLLKTNIQAQILNLQHYINSNVETNNLQNITAQLDNMINTNILFDDMHILSDKNKLLYSSDRSQRSYHSTVSCTPITNIDTTNIFTQKCYTFSIKLFHQLTPYYYTDVLYINQKYVNSLLKSQFIDFASLFFIFIAIFSLILWYFIHTIIIKPVEELRAYAHRSTQETKTFLITEYESIRSSLQATFQRMHQEQNELYTLSTKDSLSGLYNRHSLIKKLEWLISQAKQQNKEFALLFIDLDNFKNINDSVGHECGDQVLQHVANILLESVRDNDIVARLGGDEFVIVLPHSHDETNIIEITQRIKKKLALPIEYKGIHARITASIGIAIYPHDGENVTELIKHADIAMYKAKELGKNHYHFFTKKLDHIIQEKITMQQYLLDALQNNYFKLHYQPKVDIQTNTIIACEALIRLHHPQEGIIPPYKFISLAEETGLIVNIGEWVITEATQQLKKWEHTPLRNIQISINVSAGQLQDTNFLTHLKKYIQDINCSKLDIELTESMLISDFNEKIEIVNKLKELNLSLSLDDFGTGYSSLSYLKTIPFDTLKIDKAFIDDIEKVDGQSFVEMIIKIAQTLHMKVVAEGVETQTQLQMLEELGCDQYQGYYCSKPVVAKDFEQLFQTKKCD